MKFTATRYTTVKGEYTYEIAKVDDQQWTVVRFIHEDAGNFCNYSIYGLDGKWTNIMKLGADINNTFTSFDDVLEHPEVFES